MLDDAVLVYYERGAAPEASLFVEDAVVFNDFSFEIAEQRKGDPDLFGESCIGGGTVNANTENLRAGGFEFGDIRLIRL